MSIFTYIYAMLWKMQSNEYKIYLAEQIIKSKNANETVKESAMHTIAYYKDFNYTAFFEGTLADPNNQ